VRSLGINTYSYAWTTPAEECIARLSDLGYRSFELLAHPPHLPIVGFDAPSRRRLAALLARVGTDGCTMNLPSLDHNLASPWPEMRAASVQIFQGLIDLAADLGVPWIVTVPGRMSPLLPPSVADRTRWMREGVEALLPHAERRGVGLAIENVPMASFPDAASLGDFVRGFRSPGVAVCYDVANAHFIGESPAEGISLLADQIRVFHLSDTPRCVWRHDRVGTGTVPFAEVAEALRSINYQGSCMLEIIDADPEAAFAESCDLLAAAGFPAHGRERAV
jgi:sugar phosphate isomerase/epimerase